MMLAQADESPTWKAKEKENAVISRNNEQGTGTGTTGKKLKSEEEETKF